jgi:hypothetical protein
MPEGLKNYRSSASEFRTLLLAVLFSFSYSILVFAQSNLSPQVQADLLRDQFIPRKKPTTGAQPFAPLTNMKTAQRRLLERFRAFHKC